MRKVVYPAILSTSQEDFCKKIETSATFAEGVQIDVMDGIFVEAVTYQDVDRIAACKPGSLFFELHLMVEDPEKYITLWEKVADSYILHIETIADPRPLIEKIRSMKKEVGLAINPGTKIDDILPFIKDIDMVLVMTVVPGKGGQEYIADMGDKVSALRAQFPKLPIEVDGGITSGTILLANQAGANIFVAGSSIFGKADEKEARDTFLELQSKII